MQRIQSLNFILVGEWILSDDKLLHTISDNLSETKLLYSFVSENEVLYIGKTSSTLKSRMNGYKHANSSQKTNVRVKAKLVSFLRLGKKVEIYIMLDNLKLNHKGYQLCLASALEDVLIADIKPSWNDRGIK